MIRKKIDLNRIFYPFLPLSMCLIIPTFFFIKNPYVEFYWALGTIISFFLFDNLGVQIGVHKLMSHKSFKASTFVTRVCAFLAILSGQGSPLVWVAIHTGIHHKHYDQEKDIHSPIHGTFYAFLSWYWKCDPSQVNFLVVRNYLKDKVLVTLHNHHLLILIIYWLLLAIVNVRALVYLGIIPAAMSIILAGFVNSFMHSSGVFSNLFFFKYQNYPNDTTYNSWWLGLLTMGLGLHNNHHQYPTLTNYDLRWYEVDLSRYIIPLLKQREEIDLDPHF